MEVPNITKCINWSLNSHNQYKAETFFWSAEFKIGSCYFMNVDKILLVT